MRGSSSPGIEVGLATGSGRDVSEIDRTARIRKDMKLVRVRSATPLDNQRVELTLTDGRIVERDLGPLLVGPAFEEIRKDAGAFREMRVEGGTLVWPNG